MQASISGEVNAVILIGKLSKTSLENVLLNNEISLYK
jgi:hypothetical protein